MPEQTPWYCKHAPEIGNAFREFHDAASSKGVLDQRTRELLMLALACANRCRHCTEQHMQQAQDAGAAKDEIAETLLIAAAERADDAF